MNRGGVGAAVLNVARQQAINPPGPVHLENQRLAVAYPDAVAIAVKSGRILDRNMPLTERLAQNRSCEFA